MCKHSVLTTVGYLLHIITHQQKLIFCDGSELFHLNAICYILCFSEVFEDFQVLVVGQLFALSDSSSLVQSNINNLSSILRLPRGLRVR